MREEVLHQGFCTLPARPPPMQSGQGIPKVPLGMLLMLLGLLLRRGFGGLGCCCCCCIGGR